MDYIETEDGIFPVLARGKSIEINQETRREFNRGAKRGVEDLQEMMVKRWLKYKDTGDITHLTFPDMSRLVKAYEEGTGVLEEDHYFVGKNGAAYCLLEPWEDVFGILKQSTLTPISKERKQRLQETLEGINKVVRTIEGL